MDDRMRIALLIDADNASVSTLEYVLGEIADLGVANVRRAYGDWGSLYLQGWRAALLDNAIQPMQQIAYVSKGNASDMAMVVDAMDLLHSGRFDAFALMSSDSDFTPLAMRLRAANAQVYGFGKANTSNAFKAACSTFFHVDAREEPLPENAPEQSGQEARNVQAVVAAPVPQALPQQAATAVQVSSMAEPPKKRTGPELRGDTALVNLLRSATEATKGDDGWSHLGGIGNYIRNRGPFTPKNYGYRTLKPLIVATDMFEVRHDGHHIKAKTEKNKKVKESLPKSSK
jgi:uncharacterized LabA/DUF88 family protein